MFFLNYHPHYLNNNIIIQEAISSKNYETFKNNWCLFINTKYIFLTKPLHLEISFYLPRIDLKFQPDHTT